MTKDTTPKRGDLTEFATKARISIGYAHALLSAPGDKHHKRPPIETALLIYRRTGRKLGILTDASARDANAFLRLAEQSGAIPANDDE